MTNKISIMVCVILILQSRLAQAVPEEPSGEQATPENDFSDTESTETEIPTRLELDRDMKHAKIRLGFGIGLTALGGTAILSGVVVIIGDAASDHEIALEDGSVVGTTMPTGYLIGGVIAGIGVLPCYIGVALWVKGYKKKKSIESQMAALPKVSFSTGGMFNTRLMTATWTF